MDLRQLATFICVADAGSLTVAADRLHVVQSAVSVTIRSLEEELDTTLFIRSSRGTRLTEAGNALLPEARATLAAVDSARVAVKATRHGLTGTVAAAVVQSQSLKLFSMPSLLKGFYRSHPNVDVRLRHHTDLRSAIGAVSTRSLDVGFFPIGPDDPLGQGLLMRVVASDAMQLAVPAGHPLSARKAVTLGQLTDEIFADFLPGGGSRATTDRLFATAGIQRSIRYEVSDASEALQFVRDRLAVAVIPTSCADDEPGIALTELSGTDSRFEFSVGTAAGRPLSAAVRAFVAACVSTPSLKASGRS